MSLRDRLTTLGLPRPGTTGPGPAQATFPLITSLTASSRSLFLLSSDWGANG